MSVTFDPENVEDEYHTLVQDVFEGDIREMNSHYPTELSVRFDWERVNEFDEKIGRQFIRSPKTIRGKLEAAISAWDDVDIPKSVVRVHNIPQEHHFRVGKQRTTHLGQLLTIEGRIVEIEGVKPFAREAALACHKCGTLNYVPQSSYGKMIEPAECMGCEKKSGPFLFKREHSDLIDSRKIILQRADTNLDDDPPTLVVYLTQDLVDRVGPGDYVSLVGYYDTGRIQKESVVRTFLETWDIESHQEGVLADRLSPEELQERILDEVEQLQDSDASSFGADRDEVLETLSDEGIRKQEIESQLDDLIDDSEISKVGGDKLMVT